MNRECSWLISYKLNLIFSWVFSQKKWVKKKKYPGDQWWDQIPAQQICGQSINWSINQITNQPTEKLSFGQSINQSIDRSITQVLINSNINVFLFSGSFTTWLLQKLSAHSGPTRCQSPFKTHPAQSASRFSWWRHSTRTMIQLSPKPAEPSSPDPHRNSSSRYSTTKTFFFAQTLLDALMSDSILHHITG